MEPSTLGCLFSHGIGYRADWGWASRKISFGSLCFARASNWPSGIVVGSPEGNRTGKWFDVTGVHLQRQHLRSGNFRKFILFWNMSGCTPNMSKYFQAEHVQICAVNWWSQVHLEWLVSRCMGYRADWGWGSGKISFWSRCSARPSNWPPG